MFDPRYVKIIVQVPTHFSPGGLSLLLPGTTQQMNYTLTRALLQYGYEIGPMAESILACRGNRRLAEKYLKQLRQGGDTDAVDIVLPG